MVCVGVKHTWEVCRMRERSVRRTAPAGGVGCSGRGAAGTAGAGPPDRRVAVDVLVALAERDAAERSAGGLLPAMIDLDQLSPRQAVTWLGDPITIRNSVVALRHSDETVAQADLRIGCEACHNASASGSFFVADFNSRSGSVVAVHHVAAASPDVVAAHFHQLHRPPASLILRRSWWWDELWSVALTKESHDTDSPRSAKIPTSSMIRGSKIRRPSSRASSDSWVRA